MLHWELSLHQHRARPGTQPTELYSHPLVLQLCFTRSCLPVLCQILPPCPACVTSLFYQILPPCVMPDPTSQPSLFYKSALPDLASLCYARSYLPAQPVLQVCFTRSNLPVLCQIQPPCVMPDPTSLCYARSYLPAQPVLEVSFTRSCLPVLYKILPPSLACVTDLFDQITAPCPACVTSLLYQILPSQQSKQNS